jgi:hypothetical protein
MNSSFEWIFDELGLFSNFGDINFDKFLLLYIREELYEQNIDLNFLNESIEVVGLTILHSVFIKKEIHFCTIFISINGVTRLVLGHDFAI